MTPAEALKEASRAGRLGRFEVSAHAMLRMEERNATGADIACALKGSTSAALQDGARWRLEGGRDRDGDPLSLVVVFCDGCLVVTLF